MGHGSGMCSLQVAITIAVALNLSAAAQPAPPNIVERWNGVAINAIAVDSTLLAAQDQSGPTRSSRAMAIVHIAISDTVNGITGKYKSFTGIGPAPANASVD